MFRRVLAVSFCVASLACKPEVATVELTPPATTLEAANATAQLKAVSKDKDGKELAERQYAFKSSSDAVVTVDNTGKVTAKGDGEATITVSDGEKNATAKVFVAIPTRVELIPATLPLKTGEPGVDIQARVLDGKGRELPGKTVTFAIDKPEVAKIEGNKVTAVAVGTAQLTGTWEKLSSTAQVIVTEGAPPPEAAPAPAPADEKKGKKK